MIFSFFVISLTRVIHSISLVLSKFDVLKPYLKKKTKVLDYGSGISPEFIKSVQQTGAKYYAYDISPTVQNELANLKGFLVLYFVIKLKTLSFIFI